MKETFRLNVMKTSRIKTREELEKKAAIKRKWKKDEMERVKQGKKPYYLKEGNFDTYIFKNE